MSKRSSSRSSAKKRARKDDEDDINYQDILKPASNQFKLWLIEEVKKYPILYKSLDREEYTQSTCDAWEALVNSQDETLDVFATATPAELIHYCRETWKNIKRAYSRYLTGVTSGMGPIIEPMRALFGEIDKSADENNKSNDSPGVGSSSEKPAEEETPPTTNDAAGPEPQKAATPGIPRSIGARSTPRAVSLVVIGHLFDSLRSPAATTDVCNSLIELLFKYQPNVYRDIIEFGAHQPDLFNVDWSGLPIPEDLCREIWRRDAEEKLRKVYKNSSKKRFKKEN